MIIPVRKEDGVRNHPSNWKDAPEKAETHCLYCKQPVPNHAPACHVPQRTVVVIFETKMVIAMPVTWDDQFRNERVVSLYESIRRAAFSRDRSGARYLSYLFSV